MSIKRHQVKSKLAVAYVLENSSHTASYIPDTELLYRATFEQMIEKHSSVFVKPDSGRKSQGILKIKRLANDHFQLRESWSTNIKNFTSKNNLWTALKKRTKNKRYVIQQGINSYTESGRPFDLRCHALRVNGDWLIGGICARIGPVKEIVTTSHNGGTPTLIEDLFSLHLSFTREEQTEIIDRLHACVLHVVKTISPMYPCNYEFAVDIGLDDKKDIWVYEVNIEPLIRGNFKQLKDKSLYRRIRALRRKAKP
ncbi:YheC/YheD family protein [Desertibacillus haloalkaliphilus]|uniref:YheC/YheD family protein n=1 Tax=Desertibacillus haloalkaliphilus TaxID=1328930 RepID=UPI001C25B30F|nr:YheC/YheD family protein [Desertibacillus haloalkaliphilus]MBU8907560.1 YheC/YheD family protein [Desertibacillus haloalkaliphilus]